MAGEKKLSLNKVIARLRYVLDAGALTAELEEMEQKREVLTEVEYEQYQKILGGWRLQLEELEK